MTDEEQVWLRKEMARKERLRRRRNKKLLRAVLTAAGALLLAFLLFLGIRGLVRLLSGGAGNETDENEAASSSHVRGTIGGVGGDITPGQISTEKEEPSGEESTAEQPSAEQPSVTEPQTKEPQSSTEERPTYETRVNPVKPTSAPPVAYTEGDKAKQAAERQAAMYDYDAAIATLQACRDKSVNFSSLIASYQAEKASLQQVNPRNIPHVFFHSLICDMDRCFGGRSASAVSGYNSWMVSTDEFRMVIQMLYDNNYVVMNVTDLYDVNGNEVTPAEDIYLPAGKKGIVFSYDDLAYYASYQGMGFPDRLILDENGRLKNEYTDRAGVTTVGDYDWLPILDSFLEVHPDFSYHGHKGTIALTGYNGVFGYRTDEDFFLHPDYGERVWLDANPWCTYDHIGEYIEQAKVIADAIKADGYEFASHSWGHRKYGQISLEQMQIDMNKFFARVTPIIGETDIMIYAHGDDIAGASPYNYDTNEAYRYLLSVGYRCFCNVDTTWLTWMQFNGTSLRDARIDIDGYTLYVEMTQGGTVIGQLGIDAAAVFDPIRPTPVTAQ